MRTYLFLFFVIVLVNHHLHAQEKNTFFEPINKFNQEKNYPSSLVVERGYLESVHFLRDVVREFDSPKDRSIAILLNGQYLTRVQGNGKFNAVIDEQFFVKKVPLAAIEQVEARYNPNYLDPEGSVNYIGTINFVASILPDFKKAQEPPIEPWISAALLEIATPKPKTPRSKRLASSKPSAGIVFGSQLRARSIFAGVPVEVPINSRLSLQSDFLINSKDQNRGITQPDNSTVYSSYLINALEVDVLAKYYLSAYYARTFIFGGPYVELARNRWLVEKGGPSPTVGFSRQQKTAFGVNFGIGMSFYSGFYVTCSGSVIATPKSNLLYLQDFRGVTVAAGWMFGKE
jgi:Outer membrane protein beta-barrel domain